MGDVGTTDFKDIWKGDHFKNFRERILKDRKAINICRNCTSGQKVFVK
jgi:hypothetical protein